MMESGDVIVFAYVGRVRHPETLILDTRDAKIRHIATQKFNIKSLILDIDSKICECYAGVAFTRHQDKAMLESNLSG